MTTPSSAQHHDLDGRVAIITGAGTGIGAATARTLSDRGASVALLGRRGDRLAEVADAIDGLVVPVDVSDPDDLAHAFSTVREQLGVADIVVANAGAMLAAPFEQADRAEWRRMVDVNLMGVIDTAREAVPGLLATAADGRPSDLVLISSVGAHIVFPEYAIYAATKAAVTQLSRNLRAELGPRGVRVHAIEPGMTESDLGLDMASASGRDFLADFKRDNPPIPASAIAETIAWSVALPPAVNAALLEVLPTIQG